MIPVIARECSEAATWADARACLEKHGIVKVEKTLPHARLVRLTHKDDPGPGGLYLFVETKGWQLGGMVEYAGELLGFDHPRFGTHRVYHFELGSVEHSGASLVQQRQQVFCTGTGYRCTIVLSACDVLVAGKAVASFRGTVTWQKDHLHVAGDRAHAGDACEQAADVALDVLDVQ